MKRGFGFFVFALALLPIFAVAADAGAQSLLSTRGLGFPLDPQDARSRALGGVSLGFAAGEISWFSPGGIINLPAPGLVTSYQYDDFQAETHVGEFRGNTARFPLLLAGFPVGDRAVLFAGYGGYLDQNWRIEQSDTLDIGGEAVPVTDRFSSEGGVARLRLGGAYEVIEGLGVGLAVDAYTGSVDRVNGRLFPRDAAPACCRAIWSYSGVGASGGLHWTPGEATGVAASVSYGGTLEATPTDSLGTMRSYDLPLIARAGATARVTQTVMLAVGGGWEGWSTLDEALAAEGGARDTWSLNGGLEWDAITFRERPIPVRIGARTGTLPFSWRADAPAWATESAFTGGFGVLLAGGAVRTDFAAELGDRGGDDSGIKESFWRFAFSVKVLGR